MTYIRKPLKRYGKTFLISLNKDDRLVLGIPDEEGLILKIEKEEEIINDGDESGED